MVRPSAWVVLRTSSSKWTICRGEREVVQSLVVPRPYNTRLYLPALSASLSSTIIRHVRKRASFDGCTQIGLPIPVWGTPGFAPKVFLNDAFCGQNRSFWPLKAFKMRSESPC